MSRDALVRCRNRIGASAFLIALVCSTFCGAQTETQKRTTGQAGSAAPVVSANRPGTPVQDKRGKDGTKAAAPVVASGPGTEQSPAQSSGGTTTGVGMNQEKSAEQTSKDVSQAEKEKQDETAANLEKDENLLKLLTPEQRKLLESGEKIPSPTGILAEYPWLLPAIAVLLSLIAVVYVMEMRRRAVRQIDRARSAMNDLRNQLSEAEQELLTRSKPVALAERSSGRGTGKAATVRAPRTDSDVPSRSDDGEPMSRGVMRAVESYPSERESKGIPATSALRPAVPQAAPDPRKASGDIVADYNKARSMGDDGAEWFKESYTWFSLSCTNFNDRVLNPKIVLLFQEESRGSFLAVTHRGETRLVPAFHNELEVSSSFLAGIFDYPQQIAGPLVLFRAATVEKSGGLWQLRQSGEIKLER